MHVVFPGSFDPVTYGHLNVISRCAFLFDQVDVVIADNPSKDCFFSSEERYDLLSELLKNCKNITVSVWKRLMVDYLIERNINLLVRGVRTSSDYEYEFVLAQVNKGLGKGIETIFIPTDEKYMVLSSSIIKDIVMLGGDVSDKVPPLVLNALKSKLQ